MKKRRFLGTLLSMVLIASSVSFAETKVETISFEEAFKMANMNSNSLRIAENTIDTQKTLNENNIVGSGASVDEVIKDVKNQASLENRLKTSEKDKEALKESIEFLLKKTIISIDKSEKNIAIKEDTLKNAKDNLRLSTIKYDNGKISKYDLDTQRDKIEKDEKLIEIEKKSLENEYNTLDKLLGVNVEQRKKVAYEYKYEKLKDSEKEIPFKTIKSLEKDAKIYKTQRSILEKELNVRYTTIGDEPYRLKELDLAITENQLSESKKDMEEKIRNLFNNIKKNELSRESILLEMSTVKKDLEVANKKLELGKTIPQEVKNLEFKKSQIEENLKLNEIDHALLMLQYEKPYI